MLNIFLFTVYIMLNCFRKCRIPKKCILQSLMPKAAILSIYLPIDKYSYVVLNIFQCFYLRIHIPNTDPDPKHWMHRTIRPIYFRIPDICSRISGFKKDAYPAQYACSSVIINRVRKFQIT